MKLKLLGLILVLLFLISCTQQISQEEKTKIGVIAPLTGGAAELGLHIRNGIDLGNEKLGEKYDLIYEDDQCIDTKGALSAAHKFINVDKLNFVIGPLCTPPFVAVSKLFNDNDVSFMHTSGVADAQLAVTGELGIAGISASQFKEMEYLADYIFNELKIKKIALLTWNQEWALQYQIGFKKHFEKIGGEIVSDELFNTDATDYRTDVLKITDSKAEGAVILGLNFQVAKIITELRIIDKELPVFGQLDNDDSSFLEAVGENGEGMMWALPIINFENEETKWFLNRYEERYGIEPNYYDFLGYDSLRIYDHAIEICGNDGKCVTNTILGVEDFSGISGTINFEDGVIVREFGIRMIKDSKIVSLE